jgi:hypothetical protein
LEKQKKAQIQEKLQTKHQPDHTNIHYNSKNDKKTKSPKSKLTQNCSATQLHRTKTTTAIVTTKFWPTSSGSSEFGHPESITVEFLPIHHPEVPHSQFNFLDTKEHQPTMPQHAKMDFIRTKQSDIVSTLVTLSKYTAKVYTPMTPHQFQLELQTVERMKHLSTRASVTARTGQNLAPRVGPYAYYYRLFEDFYERRFSRVRYLGTTLTKRDHTGHSTASPEMSSPVRHKKGPDSKEQSCRQRFTST